MAHEQRSLVQAMKDSVDSSGSLPARRPSAGARAARSSAS
ncbi:hypothetical protein OKW34_008084 [Paraburkholderia youngii]